MGFGLLFAMCCLLMPSEGRHSVAGYSGGRKYRARGSRGHRGGRGGRQAGKQSVRFSRTGQPRKQSYKKHGYRISGLPQTPLQISESPFYLLEREVWLRARRKRSVHFSERPRLAQSQRSEIRTSEFSHRSEPRWGSMRISLKKMEELAEKDLESEYTSQISGPSNADDNTRRSMRAEITMVDDCLCKDPPDIKIDYGAADVPPCYLCPIFAMQHYLAIVGTVVVVPFLIAPELCLEVLDPHRYHLISATLFYNGVATILQATIGSRLPIVHGGSISFLVPMLAILKVSNKNLQCTPKFVEEVDPEVYRMMYDMIWVERINRVSGALVVAAMTQMVLGFSGVLGVMMRWITPLTVAPTVTLMGISLLAYAATAASKSWVISGGTIFFIILFSQILGKVMLPTLTFRKKERVIAVKHRREWFPIFRVFSVIMTIIIMWSVCMILTILDVYPLGHPARTDNGLNITEKVPTLRVPYPGQWGMPSFTAAVGVAGILAALIGCILESLCFFPIAARISAAPPPPLHAINRGLTVEGFGTLLAGLSGACNGINYSGQNLGAIAVTKVGSRRVTIWVGGIMMVTGVLSEVSATILTVPEPIIGGINCVVFGITTALGISVLRFTSLTSFRNLYILGISILFPLMLAPWLSKFSDQAITEYSAAINDMLQVILTTTPVLGGVLGCLLDNAVPGTKEERGLIEWRKEIRYEEGDPTEIKDYYDLPYIMKCLRRWKCCKYVPILPTYQKKDLYELLFKKPIRRIRKLFSK